MIKTICEVCGKEILHTGARWHRSCKPPCRVCGQPVHHWADVQGSDIHRSCAKPSERRW